MEISLPGLTLFWLMSPHLTHQVIWNVIMGKINKQTETQQNIFFFNFHVGLNVTFLTVLLLSCSGSVGTAGQHHSASLQDWHSINKQPTALYMPFCHPSKRFFVLVVYSLLKLASRLCSCLISTRMNDIFIVSHVPGWPDRRTHAHTHTFLLYPALSHTIPHFLQNLRGKFPNNINLKTKLILHCSRKYAPKYNFLLNTVPFVTLYNVQYATNGFMVCAIYRSSIYISIIKAIQSCALLLIFYNVLIVYLFVISFILIPVMFLCVATLLSQDTTKFKVPLISSYLTHLPKESGVCEPSALESSYLRR